MATGTVKWFSDEKGYGFITPDSNGDKDLFIHHSNISTSPSGFRSISEGDKVSYEAEVTQRGLKAINVQKLTTDEAPGS